MTMSRKAPRGQRFQHQNRPLKKESGKKKAIMAMTKYPSTGKNKPPIIISGNNQTITIWVILGFNFYLLFTSKKDRAIFLLGLFV